MVLHGPNIALIHFFKRDIGPPVIHLFNTILTKINSIETYDFSTLYTTIPHEKLKSRFFDIIDCCFFYKNGSHENAYLSLEI